MKNYFYILLFFTGLSFGQTEFTSIKLKNDPATINDTTRVDLLVREKTGVGKGLIKKTTWAYLMDIFGSNSIPVTGTTEDYPISGDLKFTGSRKLFNGGADKYGNIYLNDNSVSLNAFDSTGSLKYCGQYIYTTSINQSAYSGSGNSNVSISDNVVQIINTDNTYSGSINVQSDGVRVNSNDPTSQGLLSQTDFTSNITDLAYTQKKYVDQKASLQNILGTDPNVELPNNSEFLNFVNSDNPPGSNYFKVLASDEGSVFAEIMYAGSGYRSRIYSDGISFYTPGNVTTYTSGASVYYNTVSENSTIVHKAIQIDGGEAVEVLSVDGVEADETGNISLGIDTAIQNSIDATPVDGSLATSVSSNWIYDYASAIASGMAGKVSTTGNETIAGTKTYTASPVFPTPSANDNSTKGATTAYVDAADAAKITNGGNTTGATMNIGSNDAQSVVIKYNNTPVLSVVSASGVSLPNGASITNASSSGRGSVLMGTTTAGITIQRNLADAIPSFIAANMHTSSTGNIASFNSNISGTTATRAYVAKDGTFVAPKYTLSALNTAPSSSTDTGATGEIRITSTYIYVCVATNTWVRSALTSW